MASSTRALRLVLMSLAVAVGAASLARGASPAAVPGGEPGRPRVISLRVDGVISGGTAEYIAAGLARARDEGADLLLITVDTPGGHLDATRDIVQRMLASEVPTAVWVGPAGARAGSAGVFLTLAANVAAMDPASNIGAAHPVTAGGGDVEKEAGKEMAKKVENDTAAFARSVAKARHRNAEWAEKAVRESVSVTSEEALKLHVVDLVVPDVHALLAAIDGRVVVAPSGARRVLHTRDATIEPLEMTVRQRTLSALADPNVAAILMLVGTLGIALELYHPGSIIPGAAGAFCLLLAFLAMRVIPVNVGAVILLLAGVGLLVAEAYVTAHGLAGIAGGICIVLGTMLFIDKSSPEYHFDPGAFRLSPFVVWPTPIALSAVMGFVAWKVVRSRRGPLVAGAPGLIGEVGEALSDIALTGGEVFVHGEYWSARAASPVPKGARIRVVAVDGLVLTVVAEGASPAVQSR